MDVGAISGDLEIEFFERIRRWYDSFSFNLLDWDNALAEDSDSSDAGDTALAFSRTTVAGVDLVVSALNDTSIQLRLAHGVDVQSDTWINENYSFKTVVEVPHLTAQLLHRIVRDNDDPTLGWFESAFIGGALRTTFLTHVDTPEEKQREQMEFVRSNDASTSRCEELYREYFSSRGEDIAMTAEASDESKFQPLFEGMIV